MSEDTDTTAGSLEHLFAAPIRARIDDPAYGSWRSLTAPDAVSLSYGFPFPDALPNQAILNAAGTLIAEEPEQALQYGGGEYAGRLEDAVIEWADRRGIECVPEQVVLTNGATHAIDLIGRVFLEPGDHMLVEAPTFMGALTAFRNYGVDITGVPVDENGLDVEALAGTLADRRRSEESLPKLLYTIPTFQNPTGTTLPRDRRRRLLDLAEEYDFVVLEDDAYGGLRYDGDAVPPLRALDDTGRVVHVGTFSKTIAPGVRTGWVIADKPVASSVDGVHVGATNVFTRGLLGRYCSAGRLEANVEALRSAYAERRDHMLACLEEHMPSDAGWTEPAGGFFVWVTLPGGIDAGDMLSRAAEEGVTYLPGSMFFPADGGRNHLRLSFSTVSLGAMERGIEALGRTVQCVRDGSSPKD